MPANGPVNAAAPKGPFGVVFSPLLDSAQLSKTCAAAVQGELPNAASLGLYEPLQQTGKSKFTERQGGGSSLQSKAVEAYQEILLKLFHLGPSKTHEYVYKNSLNEAAAKHGLEGRQLLGKALHELRRNGHVLQLDKFGRVKNASAMGKHFDTLYKLTVDKVDLYVIQNERQLGAAKLPFSVSLRQGLSQVVEAGEVAMLWLVKVPPKDAAKEIREVAETQLYGLMSYWSDPTFQKCAEISPALRSYLKYATIRVLCTGTSREARRVTLGLNQEFERHGGFENKHWTRVVKGIAEADKKESLFGTLKVCIPVVIGVKVLERFFPGGLHAVGGMLDDLFGAILPDVSQSMGAKSLPWRERLRRALPVLRPGLISLPVAFGLGLGSAALYNATSTLGAHAAAGVLFAFACCAGTLGTSFGAFKRAWQALEKLKADPLRKELVQNLDWWGRAKKAFQESIMDVPFRVGHTLIGVPLQVALGAAAGVWGFFHNGAFVASVGMAETILGVATAAAFPLITKFLHNRRLRAVDFPNRSN